MKSIYFGKSIFEGVTKLQLLVHLYLNSCSNKVEWLSFTNLGFIDMKSNDLLGRTVVLSLYSGQFPWLYPLSFTFQQEDICAFPPLAYAEDLSSQKLHFGWLERGKPQRTSGPFPCKLQPIKTEENNTFPSATSDKLWPPESMSKSRYHALCWMLVLGRGLRAWAME